jgi:hypothetical protein
MGTTGDMDLDVVPQDRKVDINPLSPKIICSTTK